MGAARCLVVFVVVAIACARGADPVKDGPKIKTTVRRTIERFEERYQSAVAAQERRNRESGGRMKIEGIHTVKLNAASQRRFAQIWWAARYPHGRKVTPSVEIDGSVIRCSVDAPGADTESDWTDFETKIDDLPAGRYRIIGPLDEVTLDVP